MKVLGRFHFRIFFSLHSSFITFSFTGDLFILFCEQNAGTQLRECVYTCIYPKKPIRSVTGKTSIRWFLSLCTINFPPMWRNKESEDKKREKKEKELGTKKIIYSSNNNRTTTLLRMKFGSAIIYLLLCAAKSVTKFSLDWRATPTMTMSSIWSFPIKHWYEKKKNWRSFRE